MVIFSADVINAANSLSSKEARQQWEREFDVHYIQPVLGNLEQRVSEAIDLISNDDKQGTYALTD